jgi:type III restriction enzyme
MTAPQAVIDEETLDRIAAEMDLRRPNKDAVLSLAHRLVAHDGGGFEGVLDLATGVGKTYCMAALIDYLVATAGVRNFVVVAPGRTILRKTIDNFTPGAHKSLTGKMRTQVHLVTAENYNTPAVAAALADPDEVKVFVFTVQSLIAPRNETRRRLREFQEGIGERLYEYLTGADDLVVLADEHHCYYGNSFSAAIRDLTPYALVGLTATPHTRTPESQIVYRYPLAHAIAEKLVKTPVIVGRMDGLNDPETKLRDGLALLSAKDVALQRHCEAEGLRRIHPLMLVVAPDIDAAVEVETTLSDPDFFYGRYAEAVLRIDSSSPDEALAALETVEDPGSPVRVIVSVGMLKEGWDVANVYVIVSLRVSVSDILTEQTLGRGLRLPFGVYTDVELLDTLEVVAHERFEDLLRQARVLKERVIDWRTFQAEATPPQEEGSSPAPTTLHTETSAVGAAEASAAGGGNAEEGGELKLIVTDAPVPVTTTDTITATTVEARTQQAEAEAARVAELQPRPEWVPISIPVVEHSTVAPQVSLLDVTDMEAFRSFGRRLAEDPSDELRRSLISATMRTGPSGIPEVELVTRDAQDRIHSQGTLLDPADARQELVRRVLLTPGVPTTVNQIGAAEPIVEAFLEGLGPAVTHLGAWLDQAAGGLMQLVQRKLRESAGPVQLSDVVQIREFNRVRTGRPSVSRDLQSEFRRGVGYQGFRRSVYAEDWFDSRPERDLANILDRSDDVRFWLRLNRGDLTILWRGQSTWYNPDFLVRECDGGTWIIEVKADRDLESSDVQAKREAAQRWARRANASAGLGRWRYLLVGETQLRNAAGDWRRLKAVYTGE